MEGVVTQDTLRRYLRYNADGTFSWLSSSSPSAKEGSIAGSKTSGGYISIGIGGSQYKAHRLVWLYHYGYLPETDIDHRDRVRDNNKLSNLREASRQCNVRNSTTRLDNKSGITGVSFGIRDARWVASISVGGISKSLGYHKSKEEAILHRLAAEQCLGWERCNSSTGASLFHKEIIND